MATWGVMLHNEFLTESSVWVSCFLRSFWCSLVVGVIRVTGLMAGSFRGSGELLKWRDLQHGPYKTMRWNPYASHNPSQSKNHFPLAVKGVAVGSDSIRPTQNRMLWLVRYNLCSNFAIPVICLWLSDKEGAQICVNCLCSLTYVFNKIKCLYVLFIGCWRLYETCTKGFTWARVLFFLKWLTIYLFSKSNKWLKQAQKQPQRDT